MKIQEKKCSGREQEILVGVELSNAPGQKRNFITMFTAFDFHDKENRCNFPANFAFICQRKVCEMKMSKAQCYEEFIDD